MHTTTMPKRETWMPMILYSSEISVPALPSLGRKESWYATGPVSALVELPDGCVVRRHQDHLRKDPSIAEQGLKSAPPEPDMAASDPPLKPLKQNQYARPGTGASQCVSRIMKSNIDVFTFILSIAPCD